MRFLSLPGDNRIDSFDASNFFKESAIQTEVSYIRILLSDWSSFRTPLVIRRNEIESQPQNEISPRWKTNQRDRTVLKGHHRHITANGHQRTATIVIKINATGVSATATDQWFMSDRLYMKRFIICNQKSYDKIKLMTYRFDSYHTSHKRLVIRKELYKK